MSATVKSLIVGGIGLLLALILGAQVGQNSQMIPLIITGACIGIFIYVALFRAIRFEALILGFLLFGYIVGNRGFAQIHIGGQTPIYVGELGMVVCLALLGFRVALRREQLIPRSKLSLAILAFLVIGAVRLYCDLFLGVSTASSAVILRDSATVYYALFFFIAYRVGSSPIGRALMEKCVLVACIVLLPVFIIQFVAFPELFNRITFRGYPLISHKGDLTSVYLAFASFYFFLYPARGLRRVFLSVLAVIFFLGIFIVTSRAALVGYTGAALILLLARRPKFVAIQAAVAAFALLIIGALHFGSTDQNAAYARLADKVESMADVSGNRSYRGEVGDYSADNNKFRMVWWKSVFEETLRKGPVFGLGFGYDLAAGFVRNYYSNRFQNWDTRSPHSIWVTVFGRMGAIGLLSFGLIVAYIFREAILAAKRVARRQADVHTLGFWTGAIIMLGSASFGVVLEGPMGGILFWTFLGLAASQSIGKEESKKAKSSRSIQTRPKPELPEPAFISRRRSA